MYKRDSQLEAFEAQRDQFRRGVSDVEWHLAHDGFYERLGQREDLPILMRLFCYLISHMVSGNFVPLHQGNLAKQMQISTSTISKAMKYFESIGVCVPDVARTVKGYRINPKLAYKGTLKGSSFAGYQWKGLREKRYQEHLKQFEKEKDS